ncbi:hypothetical protein [Salinibacter grassmerensis]|uniref:hypothetical protein n=1 Tax=Salinibacter grassmerensis TaxID=3040353 RepID=UPI0021E935DF|nr:hypothetical protein [Salinibacter grassmerensis]
MPELPRLFSELRRRNVFKAGGAYLASGWVLIQLADTVLPVLGAPPWVLPVFLFLLAVGLPFMLAFSWAFELTPEGLKRTEEVDPMQSQSQATGKKIQYLIAALLGVVLIGVAADRFFGSASVSSTAETSVLPGAVSLPEGVQVIAVMPFTVSGPDTEVWHKGMVSMLTTNLDGMSGLYAIDSRTVLARWREHAPDGAAADLATTLVAARATQAALAVVGDVVSVGNTMRISASVHDTQTGQSLRRLRAEGDADSFMALIDQVTVQAVEAARGSERDGQALPAPDVSALTTESLQALRAYLRGEERLRQSRFEKAIPEFERAVDLDSTFAMAHLRLAKTYPLVPSSALFDDLQEAQVQARLHLRAAGRYGSRLPARERALLQSAVAAGEGAHVRSARIMKDAVEASPSDPELWYEYSNAIYNPVVAQAVDAGTDGHFTAAFRDGLRRVLALDSTMTPAYFALTQAAIAHGDTIEARQHLRAYRHYVDRESSRDDPSAELVSLEGALQMAYGDSTQQAEVLRQFESGSYPAGGRFLGGALMRDPTAAALQAQARIGDVFAERNGLLTFRTIAWLRAGHYDKLRSFVQDTSQVSASARLSRLEAATRLVSREAMPAADVPLGLADPLCRTEAPPLYRLMGCYRQARLTMMQAPDSSAQHSASVQNARRVLQEAIPELEQSGNADLSNGARGYLASLDGLAALRAGQPSAHSVLDSAHVHLGPLVVIFGGEWEAAEHQLKAYIDEGEPQSALSLAHIIATTDPYGHHLAGRAHEAAGDMEAARADYERFVGAWRDADPNIPALQYAQAVLNGEASIEAPPL